MNACFDMCTFCKVRRDVRRLLDRQNTEQDVAEYTHAPHAECETAALVLRALEERWTNSCLYLFYRFCVVSSYTHTGSKL